MGDDLGKHEHRDRIGCEQHLLEGAVLEVRAKHAFESEQRGEQRGDPDHPRSNARQCGLLAADAEGKQANGDDEEQQRVGQLAAVPIRELEVAPEHVKEGAAETGFHRFSGYPAWTFLDSGRWAQSDAACRPSAS